MKKNSTPRPPPPPSLRHLRQTMSPDEQPPSDPERPSPEMSMAHGKPETLPHPSFQCCVCLDLLYKPVVLGCGHMCCFWCAHKAMHGLRASHCPMCRKSYYHFPSICQLIHFFLLKLQPLEYKRRGQEVLEEEKQLNCFSPQFPEHLVTERNHPENIKDSVDNLESTGNVDSKFSPEDGFKGAADNQVSVDDFLCPLCKKLLFQPVVLNCGHVYCESCLSGLSDGALKCEVCKSLQPGEFPNVCLGLNHFLEEQFPGESTVRRQSMQLEKAKIQREEASSSTSQTKNQETESHQDSQSWLLEEALPNAHVGVGCDSCGMYPIIGKRYKCKDCKEKIGFDLCEGCYNSSSKLPGRFNQQHTPDHTFELDDSHLVCKILMLRPALSGDQHQYFTDEDPDESSDVGDSDA